MSRLKQNPLRQITEPEIWQSAVRFWPLLLPAVLFLPGIFGRVAFPSQQSDFSDLLLTHYPYALDIKKSIIGQGIFPLWTNLIYSGMPLAANPLSGLWYPPGWLALVFPLPEGLSITAAIHAVWSSVGTYLLLKQMGVSHRGAILSGLTVGLLPKAAAHYSAGHITLLYAFAWTPWLLLALNTKKGYQTGAIGGLIFLADPRWAAYAAAAWSAYLFLARPWTWKAKAIVFFEAAGMSLMISAPLMIPLLELVRRSTRLSMTAGEILEMSLPAFRLINLIIPAWGTNPEWVFYGGAAAVLFFLLALTGKSSRTKNAFWLGLFGISMLISMGKLIPGAELAASLPGFSLLRVPARMLFLSGFALAVITGVTYDLWTQGSLSAKVIRRAAFGVSVFAAGIAVGFDLLQAGIDLQMLWGPAALLVFSLGLMLTADHKQKNFRWTLTLLVLAVDLLGAGFNYADWRALPADRMRDSAFRQMILEEEEFFRIYSPTYSISQSVAAEQNLELVYGVDPLQYQPYANYFEKSSGIPLDGYSVSLPPFPGGRPEQANRGYQPDASLLGRLNVKYLISEYPLSADGLVRRSQNSSLFVYENTLVKPRAWMASESFEEGSGQDASSLVPIDSYSANRIELLATGPGLLVLSEIAYPGWVVEVDGGAEPLIEVDGLFRGVELSPGNHRVKFIFRPLSVFSGLAIFLVGLGYFLWREKTS